jgi:hypothetical protein
MSFDLEISRGRFLNARFGVNGSQNAERSLGTSARSAVNMERLRRMIDFLNNAPLRFVCPVDAVLALF